MPTVVSYFKVFNLPKYQAMKGDEASQSIRDNLRATHPIQMARCEAVTYDVKTDRYVGHFSPSIIGDRKLSTMKLSKEMAEYLLAVLQPNAQFFGLESGKVTIIDMFLCMNNGEVTDSIILVA